jgi:diguanylate cyclase (GGDEF)-like protein
MPECPVFSAYNVAMKRFPLRPLFWLTQRPMLTAGIILIVGAFLSWRAGELEYQHDLSQQKNEIQTRVSNFRAQLETKLNYSVALIKGLAVDLVIRGEMTPEQFASIAKELSSTNPAQRNVSLAPHFIIRDVYPMAGNEKVIGLNLLLDTEQKTAVYRSIQLDDAVLAGPLELKQGDIGLVCRMPVWIKIEGVPRLWGAVSVTLDFTVLMNEAGFAALEQDLDIAVRGRDASGPAGQYFFGDEHLISKDAVRVPVFVPGGSWLISAQPKKGFQLRPWWMTSAGIIGLLVSFFSALASYRILFDRSRIRHLADHDPLTQLPNRRQALSDLYDLTHRGKRNGQPFAVLSIDLDGFKPINDKYGHDAGDEVLKAIAKRLQAAVRAGDTVARMGGDEFIVLIDDAQANDETHLLIYASRMRDILSQPMQLQQGQLVYVGASIGVAAYPSHAKKVDDLMREADQAMYRAKREKSSGVEIAHVI